MTFGLFQAVSRALVLEKSFQIADNSIISVEVKLSYRIFQTGDISKSSIEGNVCVRTIFKYYML